MTQTRLIKFNPNGCVWIFEHSIFGFVSYFDILI